jgi:hypothetical protein
MRTKYIIKDWAGNVLDFKGSFKLPDLAVGMEFDDIELALEYINENIEEDCFDDIYVVRKEGN